MSSFWPDGIEISDTQSPRDILNTAQEDWRKGSGGVLELVLQDTESESGNPMIIVHAKHVGNNRTATLFSIVHEPEKPYPARIQPEKENIPDFLKKSYYKKSTEVSVFGSVRAHDLFDNSRPVALASRARPPEDMNLVSNPWVSDTPSEFRENLSKVFNLGKVKREILNLVSSSTNIEDSLDEETIGN